MNNNVKKYRQKLGLSQQKLADLSAIGRSTISNIENNKYIPGVDIALMIAKVLKCSVEDLFKLEGEG